MHEFRISLLNQMQEPRVPRRSIAERVNATLNKDISGARLKFGDRAKENMYSELSLLLATGIDLKTSFDIVASESLSSRQRILMKKISDRIVAGARVHEAMADQTFGFTRFELYSIKLGEETGNLAGVLAELSTFYASKIRLKRQIIGMLTYPAAVVIISIVIVYFMLAFVVPVFQDLFVQTGNELPSITQWLITVSNHSSLIFLSILITSCLVVLGHRTQRTKYWYRSYTSRAALRIPIIGSLIHKTYLARFCLNMKLLSAAHVPLHESLILVRDMIGFYPFETALLAVSQSVVNEGKLLHESLSKHLVFPRKLVELIKLSEEVNAPHVIYERMHKQYSEEMEHQQAVMSKLIEPIFIVMLGLLVGFILVAMYLPMFQMNATEF